MGLKYISFFEPQEPRMAVLDRGRMIVKDALLLEDAVGDDADAENASIRDSVNRMILSHRSSPED
jgi:hypothetical protein